LKNWFFNLSTANTLFACILANLIGAYFIYMRINGTIPIGVFVGIGIFFETLMLLHFKYIAQRPSTTRDTKIGVEVARAMADKIIKEAQEHRKYRQEEE
tara:strand:+ start:808 stop:1104 length:297 start_codon:yes stop_codon:yes gene_type:complete